MSAQENLIYGIVPFEEDFYLIGPNVLQENVHLNHRLYDLPETELTRVPLYECGLTDYVRILLLLYHLKEEKPEGENDIMQEHCLESSMAQNIRKAYTEMTFERNEMDKIFFEQRTLLKHNLPIETLGGPPPPKGDLCLN